MSVDSNGNILQTFAPLPSGGDTIESNLTGSGTLTVGLILGKLVAAGKAEKTTHGTFRGIASKVQQMPPAV